MGQVSSAAARGPRSRDHHPQLARVFGQADRAGLTWQSGLLAMFLLSVFLMGGGSRSDIASLEFLRPLSVIVLGLGIWSLRLAQFRERRLVFALAFALVALLITQLVPLPPELWQALPGRELVVAIDTATGLDGTWRPLSLSPSATQNALWSLACPGAVLLLGGQMTQRQMLWLVPLLLLVGLASALLGLIQLSGSASGPAYFYRVTHESLAVGLFANRNHQAAFLATLIPLALAWNRLTPVQFRGGSHSHWLSWLPAGAYLTFVLPMILVTGSRSGMVLAGVALAASPLLFWNLDQNSGAGRQGSSQKTQGLRNGLGIVAVLGIVSLTFLLGRALSVERMMGSDPLDDQRARILPTVETMIWDYFPAGSGFGSFDRVFRIYEPGALLDTTYTNQAHNDWLDLALTGGLPAIVLVFLAIVGLAWSAIRAAVSPDIPMRSRLLARVGIIALCLIAAASLTDYPLRLPSLAAYAALMLLWITPREAKSNAEIDVT
jgi:hypothetical protein